MDNDKPKTTDSPTVQHTEQLIHPNQPIETSVTPEPTPVRTYSAIDAAEIYPDATSDISAESSVKRSFWSSDQNVADKTIASQVKTLLVLVIWGLLGEFIGVVAVAALMLSGRSIPGLGFLTIVLGLNGLLYLFLLLSKNANSVASVLKILLVLELISVFGIFFGIFSGFSLSSILSLLLTYLALTAVRGLHHSF
jgi:hypothetical protein